MSWGFKASTGAGDVQIDSEFRNLRVFQSGNCPTATRFHLVPPLYRSAITFPARPEPPLLFVRPGSTFTTTAPTFNSAITRIDLHFEGASSVPYALADEIGVNTDSGSYGMVIYDAAGKEVLDSRERLVIIEDVVQFNPGSIPTLGPPGDFLNPLANAITVSHASVPNAYYGMFFFYSTYLGTFIPEGGLPPDRMVYFAAIRQASNTSAKIGYMLTFYQPSAFSTYSVIPAVGYVFVARVSA